MIYVNSINIVHGCKTKKMGTCTFKLNIRENKILLSTSGGAHWRHLSSDQNAVLGTSFPTPGAPFLPKMSYFQSRGHNFD